MKNSNSNLRIENNLWMAGISLKSSSPIFPGNEATSKLHSCGSFFTTYELTNTPASFNNSAVARSEMDNISLYINHIILFYFLILIM